MLRRLWLTLGTVMFWLCWPLLFIYLRWSRRTRVVVRAGGQLLLTRSWLSAGGWGLPGGGLHRRETTAAGATRELREETGLVIPQGSLVELSSERLNHHGLSFTCTYFLVDVELVDVFQKRRLEISDVQWFHMSEVGGADFQPDVRRALKLLVEQGLF